jgi:L-threonylcarbamoyladenylate synthase
LITRVFVVNDEPSAIRFAAQVIQQGGLAAFPTETVYGLGASALDADAAARVFAAKQRPLNDPLIVHVAPAAAPKRPGAVEALADHGWIGALTERQRALAARLAREAWPGPLTLVLPRGERIPPIVTAGLDTVAVRMPDHPVALALIRESGVPIAAPSANRFGHVSPTTAQHVLDDLDGRIDVVLDGGPTPIGIESTVLDLVADPPVLLRPGGMARQAIERLIGPVALPARGAEPAEGEAPRSPGTLAKHYAPRAELRVVRSTAELLAVRQELLARGRRVGLLILEAQRAACADLSPVFVLGHDLAGVARNLYAGLRALDSAGADAILVSEVEATGLGEAVADRLRRGSAGA